MLDPNRRSASLASLAETIRAHGLEPRKNLGQNFLLDPNLTRRIVAAAEDLDGINVVEIGPGPGGLTRALIDSPARSITVIERDDRCLAALAELTRICPDRLRIVSGDALEADIPELIPPPRMIVANLPYNIATPLLIRWLSEIGAYRRLTLMFQKEVAERLTAAPGSKAYGRLSVLTQWLTMPRICFHLPPGAFLPPPKVTSTVVTLDPRPVPLAPATQRALEAVTAAAFGQRRKMLRSSLKTLNVAADRLLQETGIDPTQRAETLTVEEFCALARAYEAADPLSLG